MSRSSIFPLLLLTREGLTDSDETKIFDWLGGVQPATFSCLIEQTAGDDSDSILVQVIGGSVSEYEAIRAVGGNPALLSARQLSRLADDASPTDPRRASSTAQFSSIGRATAKVWGGRRRQITWDVSGGTWNVSVWLEASAMRDGRLYSLIDDSTGELKSPL